MDDYDYNYNESNIKLRNQLLTIGVITILILTGVYVLYPETKGDSSPIFKLYRNNKNIITNSYFIELDNAETDPWQFEAAVVLVPAIMGEKILGGKKYQPLIFSTTPDRPGNVNKYKDLNPTIKISGYGADSNEASMNIAEEFWTKINTIVLVSDYRSALVVSPLATKLNLPIIIDGPKTKYFINDNNIKSAITLGSVRNYNDIGIKRLNNDEELWQFYFDEVIEPNNEKCEYIVVVNPFDINYNNPKLFLPGLSLVGSVLATGHNGIILAKNYMTNISWSRQLGYGLGDAGSGERGADKDTITEDEELELLASNNKYAILLDNDINEVADFLKQREHDPKYLALVGGPAALPMMYVKSPVWYEDVDQEEKGEEYIATDLYYGDLDVKLGTQGVLENNYDYKDEELYEQEFAVGRIVGTNLCDASTLVARSLTYWDYEYIDDGNELIDWKRRAVIVTSLMTGDSDNLAAKHQQEVLLESFIIAEQYNPDRIAATENVQGLDVKSQMENVNAIIFDGHGYPDGWYHMWTTTGDEDANWDRIGAEDIYDLTIHAVPVFGACCLSSALDWPVVGGGGSSEKEMTPENCMSLAFIHAGAICYIGATEESWGAFFGGLVDENPDAWGLGDFDLPTMLWEYILDGYPIGLALNKAKEKFLTKVWTDTESKPFAHLCMLETVLYGDPAAQNGNPGLI